ncbi:MAG: hypothetical protein ILP07_02480 [Treponema sp.]|nr:hypothetical protein [Treponema sp.]
MPDYILSLSSQGASGVQAQAPMAEMNLSEGDRIFVRVLDKTGYSQGMNRYTVFAGGIRFSVASRDPIHVGDNFHALVHIEKDGTIVLERIAAALQTEHNESLTRADFLNNVLFSMGLPRDDISLRVLLFMYQSGMRLDSNLVARARNIGLRFPGREKLASEAAAILIENGIEPSDEKINELLALVLGDGDGRQGGENQSRDGEPERKKSSGDKKSGNDEDFLSRIYGTKSPEKAGLLTYLNQVAADRKHWIFLPYEWDSPSGLGRGMIRMLLDLDSRRTEKIQINCKISSTKYFFVLYYNISSEMEVRFFTLPPLLPSKVKSEELRLGGFLGSGMNKGKPVTVTYSDSACIDGICSTNEVPSFVEEEI